MDAHSLRQFLQSQGMFPAFAKPTITQGYQCSYSQHERISVHLLGGLIEEGTNASIVVIVDEISFTRLARWSYEIIDSVHEVLSDIV